MKQDGNCLICKLVTLLTAIGAINWGLVAFFQTDLVASLFGPMTTASQVVYGIVGVAGVIKLVSLVKNPCPCCKKDAGTCSK